AVDDLEGLVRAGRCSMHGSREYVLPRACLSQEEHRGIAWPRAFEQPEDAAHREASSTCVAETVGFAGREHHSFGGDADQELRVTYEQEGAGLDERLFHCDAAHANAVPAVEVANAKAFRGALERHVISGHRHIREDEIVVLRFANPDDTTDLLW